MASTDSFDDTVGTALSAHLMDTGETWLYNGIPTLTIQTPNLSNFPSALGQVLNTTGGSVHNRFAYIDFGYSNFDMTCNCYINNSNGTTLLGFPFRFSSSNNYVLTYIQKSVGGVVLLVRTVVNGSLQSIIDSTTVSSGEGIFRITTIDDNVDIYWQDNLELSVIIPYNQTETKHGIYGWYSVGTSQYDEYSISEYSNVPEIPTEETVNILDITTRILFRDLDGSNVYEVPYNPDRWESLDSSNIIIKENLHTVPTVYNKTYDSRIRSFFWPSYPDSIQTFKNMVNVLKSYRGTYKQLHTNSIDYLSHGWKNIRIIDVETVPIRGGQLRYGVIVKYEFAEEI